MFASRLTERGYLRDEQYRDAGNLRARMALHARFSVNRYPWQRWVFDRLDLPAAGHVLELGPGPGRLWIENADRLPVGPAVVLGDLSPGMVREARRGIAADPAGPTFTFAAVDAQDLPFADAAFDVVIANHMLYHLPDRARALAEIRRVLRPGGHLYAATNGAGHLRELGAFLPAPAGGADLRPPLAFTLENGRDQLARVFAHVALDRYDDALVVTEAAPLLAYILSAARPAPVEHARLVAAVGRELAAHGAIRIAKSTGLFTAR